ncbi:HlyD family secretion protein [Pleionea sediminis]|uniref:HlyD family secretion protein n=1 Tax=Pleionea sediminis TaxID=2569479 RepID=UPI0011866B0C|nr:HlyD family efflux transporter periplasmic adaptor subunit [Pleionea sediminis]
MKDSLFRKEVMEHKRERLWGDVLLIQPISFTVLSFGITLLVVLIILLLLWGEYARKETVQGYLVPSEGLSKIFAVRNGTVVEQFVQEGQAVKKGDKLVTISTAQGLGDVKDVDEAIVEELKQTKQALFKRLTEEQRLNDIEAEKLAEKISGLTKELQQQSQQVALLKERFKSSSNRLKKLDSLKEKGHVSQTEYQTRYESHLDNQIQLNNAERNLESIKNNLKTAQFDELQLPIQFANKMIDIKNRITDLRSQMLTIQSQGSYTLTAPSDGQITALQTHQGATVQTSTPIMSILPQGAKFEAELFIPTNAVGFIEPGNPVMIRYSAFPYQRFGIYKGEIEKISEVILSPSELPVPVSLNEPVYRVRVSLEQQDVLAYGKSLPLQAGMLLDADIILEKLSLFDWILDPLYSLKGRL